MTFSAAETAACQRLIEMALLEDLNGAGDVTSQAVIPADHKGQAVVVARSPGVLAGLPAAAMVFAAIDPAISFQPLLPFGVDGSAVPAGSELAVVSGPLRAILTGERTALNIVQYLSGIATLTRRFVDAIAGLPGQILDTRKTLPGWRLLAKYAVRCGGGHNHRMGLFDGILIKDNHLAALGSRQASIAHAVATAAQHGSGSLPIEIEVDSLEQFDEALASAPAIILLDNMSPEQLREAVLRRDAWARDTAEERWVGGHDTVLLEASGGVNLQTVRAIAETGVDRISIGALTHSAPALDIALDYQHS